MRIVHVTGHEFLARTIQKCFERRGDECHPVLDARQALDVVRDVEPDAVITSFEAFPLNGAMLARQVIEEFPDASIVLFTMSQDPFTIRASLEAGACGYVSKASSFVDLCDVVDRLAAGDRVLSADYAAALLNAVERADLAVADEDQWMLRQVAAGVSTADIELDSAGDGPRTRLSRVLCAVDRAELFGSAIAGVSSGFLDVAPIAWPGGAALLPPVGWRWALALRSIAAGMERTERLLRGITKSRDAFEMGQVLGMSDADVVNRLDRTANLLGQPEVPISFLVNEPLEALSSS